MDSPAGKLGSLRLPMLSLPSLLLVLLDSPNDKTPGTYLPRRSRKCVNKRTETHDLASRGLRNSLRTNLPEMGSGTTSLSPWLVTTPSSSRDCSSNPFCMPASFAPGWWVQLHLNARLTEDERHRVMITLWDALIRFSFHRRGALGGGGCTQQKNNVCYENRSRKTIRKAENEWECMRT